MNPNTFYGNTRPSILDQLPPDDSSDSDVCSSDDEYIPPLPKSRYILSDTSSGSSDESISGKLSY